MRINVRQVEAIIAMHHSGMQSARIADMIELTHLKHMREQAIIRAQSDLALVNEQLVRQMEEFSISSNMLEDF